MHSTHSLLCLGDSYTIGESVLPRENFPNQVIGMLRQSKYEFEDAEIIAKTGWTTDELQDAINVSQVKEAYDFVTLLIGVNNQYRGRSVEEYIPQFESLLKQAIYFANGNPDHVIVLSIPDWGITPFATSVPGTSRAQISTEIDSFNRANKRIAGSYKVNYIDITPSTREAFHDQSLLAPDGLHPSGKEYSIWAEKVYSIVKSRLN